MKKLAISILVIGLLFSITSLGFSQKELQFNRAEEIFIEIEETEDKILIVDKIIGDRHVKYWQHVVSDVLVKNDSILLNIDPETGDILEYERSWTDIKFDIRFSEDIKFVVNDYLMKISS